ncbi:MAG: hypothetical protein EAX90_06165 [Candidatus Heimdallarchaeota archaeon]|nr:hypothetical protein [Candidatus Heimdallarchaeota archaeon]
MSEEAKSLLKRLKKEKKTAKQIDLIRELKNHNQEEIVNHVLLVHLERKDHDSLRLEILNALNYNFEIIVQPLSQILNDSNETLPIKEKAITLLGHNRGKKALKVLLKQFKKSKDSKIKDNIAQALTYFDDKAATKIMIKSLYKDELRLHVLTGLARNDFTVYGSKELIKELVSLKVTERFEKLHLEKIIDGMLEKFKFSNIEEFQKALKENRLDKAIEVHRKEQVDIDAILKKVEM